MAMWMNDAVIDLHRFLGTYNTMEIEHMISNNTVILAGVPKNCTILQSYVIAIYI